MRLAFSLLPRALLPLVTVTACGMGAVECAPLPPWAVAVNALNGTLEDSLRHDRLVHLSSDSLLVGGSTVGLVEVRVEHPDYQPWVAANVETRLTQGECPAWEAQLLTARLQPAAP